MSRFVLVGGRRVRVDDMGQERWFKYFGLSGALGRDKCNAATRSVLCISFPISRG
jgi:hypothetical protein